HNLTGYVLVELADGRLISGCVLYYSDRDDTPSLFLEDAAWIDPRTEEQNPSMVQVFSLAVNLVFARSVFLTQKPTIPVPIKVTERPLFPRHNYSVLAFAPESPLLSGSRPTRHPERLFAKGLQNPRRFLSNAR